MIEVKIKPLSVNKAWKGRRYPSDDYNMYKIMLKSLLIRTKIDLPKPPYRILLVFGFASSLSDWDNPIKPFQDIIATHYKFNDKLIKGCITDVEQVKKGEEFVMFKIVEYEPILSKDRNIDLIIKYLKRILTW